MICPDLNGHRLGADCNRFRQLDMDRAGGPAFILCVMYDDFSVTDMAVTGGAFVRGVVDSLGCDPFRTPSSQTRGYTHARAQAHTRARTHARTGGTHTQTHTHMYTPMCTTPTLPYSQIAISI